MRQSAFQPSLKGRALRLLSQREHSRTELERKLAAHEQTPGELASALDDLQARDFINEGRVIDSVVHRRSSKLGASRIKQELAGKGVTGEAVLKAMTELRATELSRALNIWRKKFGEPPADQAARAKQVRFLVSRGFAPDAVKRVVAGTEEFE